MSKPKKQSALSKILALLFAVLLLGGSTAGALAYYEVTYIPFLSSALESFGNKDEETAMVTASTDNFSVPVTKQSAVPNGYTGIYTADDLDAVRHSLSGNYILMNDIDLESWGNWNPIGDSDDPFSGVFDGNGHVIKNMTVDMENSSEGEWVCAGLFGYVEAGEIKNLGMAGGGVSTSSGTDTGIVAAGGIAGYSAGIISNCYNTGDVNATSDYVDAGGIAGYPTGTINNCYNTGDVNASGVDAVNAGGIAGAFRKDGTINNCYNTGDVNATGTDAGIIAAGGIAGFSWTVTISNCYNAGDVKASGVDTGNAGGIAGYSYEGTISNCYYLDNITEAIGFGSPTLTNVSVIRTKSNEAGRDRLFKFL